jgi:hypothetical protein
MNRFTLRSALVLAVVLLLAGATTSFAQVIFSASAGNPQVRIGGSTEAVGDITLTSNGAVFPAGSGNAVITLTYSTTITNKTLGGAVPAPAAGVAPLTNVGTSTVSFCGTASNATAAFGTVTCSNLIAVGAGQSGANVVIGPPATSVAGIQVTVNHISVTGPAAASQGVNITWAASGNTLTITFSPTTGAIGLTFNNLAGANASITIHGVRLNAAGLGIPPALPTVSTFVNTTPSANIQLAAGSTSLTVGTLANALGTVTRLSGSTNTSDLFYSLAANLVTNTFGAAVGACVGSPACNKAVTLNPKSSYTNCGFRDIPQGAAAGGTVIITGDEATIDRNGARNFGGNGGNNAIGIKIVEGYPGALTSKTDEATKSNTAEVDNGLRIRIDLSGLPAQVVTGSPIRVLAANASAAMAVAGLSMDLVGNTQCAVGACGVPQTALADVRSASGGAVTIEYEVTTNTGGGAGTASGIVIPIFLFQSTSPVDLTTVNISVRLGPILGSSIVRFSDQQTASTATVAVTSCSTELFYPFVTNTAGFDTGIYVLNGGQARGGSTGQSGTCAARFFDGSTTGTTAVKTSTLPTLGPGQSFSFTASDATLGKPGFGNGYVQVTCNFEAGHGAAYVTFGFGTAAVGSAPPGTMYLALIDDSRGSRSSR